MLREGVLIENRRQYPVYNINFRLLGHYENCPSHSTRFYQANNHTFGSEEMRHRLTYIADNTHLAKIRQKMVDKMTY